MKWIRWIITFLIFIGVLAYPSRMNDKFQIFMTKQVSIRVNKQTPAFVAYEAVIQNSSIPKNKIVTESVSKVVSLSTNFESEVKFIHPLAKKIVLSPITIKKQPEILIPTSNNLNQDVSEHKVQISTENQFDYENNNRSFTREVINSSEWIKDFKDYYKNKNLGIRTVSSSNGNGNKLQISDKTLYEKQVSSELDIKTDSNKVIGHFSITGIPISNDHKIEIRRYEEGTFREQGRVVNLQESSYEILPNEIKGFLVGRVINKLGYIEGEGVVRLSDSKWSNDGFWQGPHIQILKKSDVRGRVISSYNLNKEKALDSGAVVSIAGGQKRKQIGKNGAVEIDGVGRDSISLFTATAFDHQPSQQVLVTGAAFTTELLPQKMATALKSIVSDMRNQNLTDPAIPIIFGKAQMDGLAMSGVAVSIENTEGLQPIYFNEMMLPDDRLKNTSSNGYFAFVGADEGLTTVYSTRIGPSGPVYFSHVNTISSAGAVSIVDLATTAKNESVDIKVYDPFTGLPQEANLEIQSVQNTVLAENGLAVQFLPQVARWSLLFAEGDAQHVPAHYSYSDKTDYIYVPRLSRNWLNYVFSQMKLNYRPSSNMVVGFSIDEDFSVDISGLNEKAKILYFDYTGRPVERGQQGGGYLIYDLPEGSFEVLLSGDQSQKIYTRVAPLKQSDIFVFTYKADY